MDYYRINNEINIKFMKVYTFLPCSKEDLINTFGESTDYKWKLSTYFHKNMYIVYNVILDTVLLYANSDITTDNLSDVSEYIQANCESEENYLTDSSDYDFEDECLDDELDSDIHLQAKVMSSINFQQGQLKIFYK